MTKVHVITPVKDSWDTTKKTVEAISRSVLTSAVSYTIYNDYSNEHNSKRLTKITEKYGFGLIHLSDITSTPSPNYRITLQHAQNRALEENAHLIIVESDVIVAPDTLQSLIDYAERLPSAGVIGAVTVDKFGEINYPYEFMRGKEGRILDTRKRISFCCSLISNNLLQAVNFNELSPEKSWFDVFISHKSLKLNFKNYLITSLPVVHLPHSSRPWKHLKYSNPFKYYLLKWFKRRDRI